MASPTPSLRDCQGPAKKTAANLLPGASSTAPPAQQAPYSSTARVSRTDIPPSRHEPAAVAAPMTTTTTMMAMPTTTTTPPATRSSNARAPKQTSALRIGLKIAKFTKAPVRVVVRTASNRAEQEAPAKPPQPGLRWLASRRVWLGSLSEAQVRLLLDDPCVIEVDADKQGFLSSR